MPYVMVRVALCAVLAAGACGPAIQPTSTSRAGDPWTAADLPTIADEPAFPPECLTESKARDLIATLGAGELRLIGRACKRRTYVDHDRRYVVWVIGDGLRAKSTEATQRIPSAACIEQGMHLARAWLPYADTILRGAEADDPALFTDAEVGPGGYVECDRDDRPDPHSVATMLHETNHRLSQVRCVFDFERGERRCLDLPTNLPAGTLARYAQPPLGLDAEGVRWLRHLETTYLDEAEQGPLELLDEVMAYRISLDLRAEGLRRGIVDNTSFQNLPALMAMVVRYQAALAVADPPLAARVFGPGTPARTLFDEVLAAAERTYQAWLAAGGREGSFERVMYREYLGSARSR